nr:hypothetical protein [Robertkochia sp. 3YJGBD-33]
MKKYLVLAVLFVLPIVAYVFFASGVNNFGKLPVVTEEVAELGEHTTLEGNEGVALGNKITILGFLGENLDLKKTNAFNLNQKIYKRFNGFEDFQFVMVLPEGTEDKAAALKMELAPLADVGNWNFVFVQPSEIQRIFSSLNTSYDLGEDLGSDRVFIIDKERRLRGRVQDEDHGLLAGYDATSVAEINNKMVDDVKVILAEYRLALKKNNINESSKRDAYLKINQNDEK